ncbi:MAG: hypothetical protein EG828_06645 [Deltaproteobacteria bacterium]|nr:hypothetical protein [Deltaproteobacteria bacterium]
MIDSISLRLPAPILMRSVRRLEVSPRATRDGRPSGKWIDLVYDDGVIDRVKEVQTADDELLRVCTKYQTFFLRFSVAKFATGGDNNVKPVSLQAAKAVFELVEEYLWDKYGLVTDIRDAGISSIDLFGNSETSHTFPEFRSLFELLRFRFRKGECWDTTHLRYNSRRAATIYDKEEEQISHYHEVKGLLPKTLRWEMRWQSARAVQEGLGITTVAQLLDQWYRVRQRYNDEVYKALRFDQALADTARAATYPEAIRSMMQRPGEPKAVWRLIRALGVRDLFGVFPSLDAIRDMLIQAGYSYHQINRLMDEIVEARWERLVEEEVSISDLRDDLYYNLRTE